MLIILEGFNLFGEKIIEREIYRKSHKFMTSAELKIEITWKLTLCICISSVNRQKYELIKIR